MKIPINQLKTCPINSEIYRDSDVGDLVNSIGEVGLLQPIVVTPDNTIISGHRRFNAIQSLGWDEVEVEVKEVCLLYTSPSPRDLSTDLSTSRMPSSA